MKSSGKNRRVWGVFGSVALGLASVSAGADPAGTVPTNIGPIPARTWEVLPGSGSELPSVKVEPSELYLGDMLPNTTREGEIRLTNTGTQTITIQQVKSNCTCTVATPEQKVIEPGKSSILKASLEASDGIANVVRQVAVVFEGYAKPLLVKVRADVSYGVHTEMRFTPQGQTRSGEILVRSIDQKPFRVLAVGGRPPVYFKAFDPAKDALRNEYILRFDLSGLPSEQVPKWLAIETDHSSSPVIDVPMRTDEPEDDHKGTTSWSFKEKRLLLGKLAPGSSTEVTATLRLHGPDVPAALDALRPFGDAAKVELVSVEPGAKSTATVRLRVTPRDGLTGLVYVKVMGVARGEEQPLFLIGRVGE